MLEYLFDPKAPSNGPLTLLDRIDKGDKIGNGTFGQVYATKDDKVVIEVRASKIKVVIKVIKSIQDKEDDAHLNEIKIGMSMVHDNIVKYVGYFYDCSSHLCLVMERLSRDLESELVSGQGNLAHSDQSRLSVSVQLARGMAHAHSQSPAIIHRDLKPANCLVSKSANGAWTAKIGDWG